MIGFLLPAGIFGLAWWVSQGKSQDKPLYGPGFGGTGFPQMMHGGGAPMSRHEMSSAYGGGYTYYGGDEPKKSKKPSFREMSYQAGVRTGPRATDADAFQTRPPRQRPSKKKAREESVSMFRTDELFEDPDFDDIELELDELDI